MTLEQQQRAVTEPTDLPQKKKRKPPHGPLTLERWPLERELAYRALLLYAMQHPIKRSLRAVARAIRRSQPTTQTMAFRQYWAERVDSPTAEVDAVRLYRELYIVDWGQVELPEVEGNVAVPWGPGMQQAHFIPKSPAQEAVRAADQVVVEGILKKRKAEDEIREKHIGLVDGGLGYVVREMNAGRIKASLRDIKTLLEARAILTGEADHVGASGDVTQIESPRVRAARASGGDVLDAAAEDIAEMEALVRALRVRREPMDAAESAEGLRLAGSAEPA